MEVNFLTPLDVQEVGEMDPRWRLLSDFRAVVYADGELPHYIDVPAGFITDFATVPRVPFAFLLYGDTAHKAAVLHDYLYSVPCDRAYADRVLRAAMATEGQPFWRRWPMWAAVRVFGARHAEAAT